MTLANCLKKFFGRKEGKKGGIKDFFYLISEKALEKNINEWEYIQEKNKINKDVEKFFINVDQYQLCSVKTNKENEQNKYFEYSLEISVPGEDWKISMWTPLSDIKKISILEKITNTNITKEELLRLYNSKEQGTDFLLAFYKKIDTEYQQLKKS